MLDLILFSKNKNYDNLIGGVFEMLNAERIIITVMKKDGLFTTRTICLALD